MHRLGVVAYAEGLALQQRLVEQRKAGAIADQLLLLEHPPVITLGVKVRTDRSNILASPSALQSAGVEMFETGRGGDVTYHGPGQLVGYPIVDLRPDRCDVHRYVRDLEQVMIAAVAEFGVQAERVAGLTGAWVSDREARGDRRSHLAVGYEPRLRAQRESRICRISTSSFPVGSPTEA